MKLVGGKNHFGGQILYRILNPPKNGVSIILLGLFVFSVIWKLFENFGFFLKFLILFFFFEIFSSFLKLHLKYRENLEKNAEFPNKSISAKVVGF